jgi:hypothetical protein
MIESSQIIAYRAEIESSRSSELHHLGLQAVDAAALVGFGPRLLD